MTHQIVKLENNLELIVINLNKYNKKYKLNLIKVKINLFYYIQ